MAETAMGLYSESYVCVNVTTYIGRHFEFESALSLNVTDGMERRKEGGDKEVIC